MLKTVIVCWLLPPPSLPVAETRIVRYDDLNLANPPAGNGSNGASMPRPAASATPATRV